MTLLISILTFYLYSDFIAQVLLIANFVCFPFSFCINSDVIAHILHLRIKRHLYNSLKIDCCDDFSGDFIIVNFFYIKNNKVFLFMQFNYISVVFSKHHIPCKLSFTQGNHILLNSNIIFNLLTKTPPLLISSRPAYSFFFFF
jgi:hypothetical protein